jgi:hypothetical protein
VLLGDYVYAGTAINAFRNGSLAAGVFTAGADKGRATTAPTSTSSI